MPIELDVPFYSYDSLRQTSIEFLRKHNSDNALPVPVEEIAEIKLGIDIIPVAGLQSAFDIDGFISSDLSCITVDQFNYEKRLNRYRFTIAHEMAHLVLHRDVFAKLQIQRVQDWLDFQENFPEKEYGWLEWQAYSFAGLVLVPPDQLREHFDKAVKRASDAGLNPQKVGEIALHYIAQSLGQVFQVSPTVVEKRILKDELWKSSV
jgi:Zn-dependent peptidase ImmA (M78 family)